MTNRVQKVVVVGGGTAGWLTAGILASQFSPREEGGIEVVLIESPDVATIGVGEGTWPSMRSTLQNMGISETDFIRECDVSIKQGSRFDNWVTGAKDSYYHPFSLPIAYGEHNLARHWQNVRDQVSFADAVSAQSKVCDQGLAAKQISTPEYAFQLNYGYHLDAAKFAGFLSRHCTEGLSVRHVQGHVEQVNIGAAEEIVSLSIRDSEPIAGDLFIDCTGMAALLIGQHYQIPFYSVADTLFNDTALAAQVPYTNDTDPIASATIATAQSAGWVWNIGLPTRRGIGYVYSSRYVDENAAERELRDYLAQITGRRDAEELSLRKISFDPGYRQKFWHKNCVAIGLSAGFVEPLEASALVLVELSAKMLAEQMPASNESMPLVADRFNQKFSYRWQSIIDFLKLHYVLNQQDDDAYWQAHRQIDSVPISLQNKLRQWRHQTPWLDDAPQFDEMFPSASFQYVLYGMGFITNDNGPRQRAYSGSQDQANILFRENIEKTAKLLKALPDNRSFLNRVAEHGLQKI